MSNAKRNSNASIRSFRSPISDAIGSSSCAERARGVDTLAGAIDTIVDALMLSPAAPLAVAVEEGDPPEVIVSLNGLAWRLSCAGARQLQRELRRAAAMLGRRDLHNAARWVQLQATRGEALVGSRAS